MKPAFLGTIKKNLFGIITAVLSAGVLLGFLFSADGIASLARISQNMRYERSRGNFLSVFPLFFFGRDNYPRHGCLENHVLLSEFPHRMYLYIYCRPVA